MSRVGKYPVVIPDGVQASLAERLLTVRGGKGSQSVPLLENINVVIEEGRICVSPRLQSKQARQSWGTTRALIRNAVVGVSEGFVTRMELKGVGYRAQAQGDILKLGLGFSHDVNFQIPNDVEIVVEGERGQLVIAIAGADKQRVGQVASDIRRWRPPEPYKGKGIRYVGEKVFLKEGKKK